MTSGRKILAIRFARLGDVILLLPALSAIKTSIPQAHLSLLTGHRCAPVAEMCPFIDEVISINRVAMRDGAVWRAVRDMKQLVLDIRKRQFDTVIDFHSFRETNLLTWFSRAPQRIGMRRYEAPFMSFCFNLDPVHEDKTVHVSEMFMRVVQGVPGVSGCWNAAPQIRIADRDRKWVETEISRWPVIALYVDAPVSDRRWPPERFAAVADFTIDALGAQPIILASGTGRDLVARVLAASRNASRIRAFDNLPLSRLAAVIGLSKLLISNDTGPMHLGPALGIPTLALFSVGFPEHFRPIGAQDWFLRATPIERISVEEVIGKAAQMWATADPDPLR